MQTWIISTALFFLAGAALAADPTPYAQWKHGPPADPSYFPIGVWLQGPHNAARYKAAGINLYVALWDGPTDEQLQQLKAAGMQVICQQNSVGLQHLDDPTIVGWMQPDEPDNAQETKDPKTGKRGYGPPTPAEKIIADYEKMRGADPSRPVYLGLGQGVTNEQWHGRGSSASPQDYLGYVRGADIVGYDIYPMAEPQLGAKYLWLVPQGVDRLRHWTGGEKPTWNCIECTNINGRGKATPDEVKSEVWMSLIHGSRGLIYFVHQFKPKFSEHGLLDDPDMLKGVTQINHQIRDLAPILNSPTIPAGATARSSTGEFPIDLLVKHHSGATYIFSVSMQPAPFTAIFTIPDLTEADIQVLGEDRHLRLHQGAFQDDFARYGVHLYQITPQ